jgi:hypothetical protein
MKKLFLLLLFYNLTFSQSIIGRYTFENRENRTESGWEVIEIPGEVTFYGEKSTKIVTIVTSKKLEYLYVKSIQLFIRQDTFIYTLTDENYKECSFRIVVNSSLDTIDLYYYSDRKEDKYYRLKLRKIN